VNTTFGSESGISLDDLTVEVLEPRLEFAAPQCMFGPDGACMGAWEGGSWEIDCAGLVPA
jgi:hypothetical protein